MSGFAGTLDQRVTLLVRAATRDDLGGASGDWRDGATLWAAVRPDGVGPSDEAGSRSRWIVSMRTTFATVMVERLRWRDVTLAVRRVESDPVSPERLTLRTEEVR